jgi:hypothetical protein
MKKLFIAAPLPALRANRLIAVMCFWLAQPAAGHSLNQQKISWEPGHWSQPMHMAPIRRGL